MTAIKALSRNRRLCSALLIGTALGGLAAPAFAQQPAPTPGQSATPAPAPVATAPAPAPASAIPAAASSANVARVVRSIAVSGNQRLEPETVISYLNLRPGETFTAERLDQAVRDLYATELFADVQIRGVDTGDLVIQVRENPVINRILIEGNKRLKDDKIRPEIRLAPRQIFTRSKARADVARIVELYQRQGRFAAHVEPKIIQLDQNRVDVVFEIDEGEKSKVRQINIIGNEHFSDSELRSQMVTKQARPYRFLSSNDVYDPDRLAYDQQKLRQFYLTQGYADFRVISAVAELTPDKRDFIITYVVEEGERYKFGDVKVESNIRDFKAVDLQKTLPMEAGDWYDAKLVEDTVTRLNETAGLFGYAFADVQPDFERNKEKKTMAITFKIAEAPRVYVERIDINGNTNTRDKVVRREFRLAEGDPFNSVAVKRSRDRIQSLGFFQEKLEIEQSQGSAPDRVVLTTNLEEKSTGELNFSAGYSSLERFLINLSVTQRNFMGRGQTLSASVNYSSFSRSAEIGFTEPYVFNHNVLLGVNIYRRDLNSFNLVNNQRNTNFQQVTTGGQLIAGVPLTEYAALQVRYALNYDEVTLNKLNYYSVDPATGNLVCDPLRAGRYLCEAVGNRLSSMPGYSLVFDNTDNRLHPSRGQRFNIGQDFAGLGGNVRYLRTRASGAKFFPVGKGFILSTSLEGGYIHSFEHPAAGTDPVRIIDRFYLGEPQIRGFDIRGVGPRVQRLGYDENGNLVTDPKKRLSDDALGGRAYYLGRIELEIPLGASVKELGLRPSLFMDVGALWGLRAPALSEVPPGSPATFPHCVDTAGTSVQQDATATTCPAGQTFVSGVNPFKEFFLGNTPRPRVSIGIGINWNSPFGPFRIDIAKALITAPGDNTKLLTFNVGTAF